MIIGVTGTLASGKDTVADYLIEKGFSHFSLSEELRAIARVRGVEETRDNLLTLANQIRDKKGPDFLAKEAFKKIKGKTVISSIRQPAEIDFLKDKLGNQFKMLGVDAPVKLRFERSLKRARPGDQAPTLKDFIAKEKREMISDKNAQNIGLCMKKTDLLIQNDKDLATFYRRIEKALNKLEA